MKIQDAYLAGAAASELNRAQQTQPAAPAHGEEVRKTPPLGADAVGISELSLRLLELARGQSPEHLARLERLATQIRSGRYRADAGQISRRLVEDALTRPA